MYRSFCCRRSAPLDRTTASDATDTRKSRCQSCPVWQSLPTIRDTHCAWPARLSRKFDSFTPALWVISSRCYWRHAEISEPIRRGSDLFFRFKSGLSSLAFPLALSMYEALKHRSLHFDCVVPIPLSPDKQELGLHQSNTNTCSRTGRSLGNTLCGLTLFERSDLEALLHIRRLDRRSIRVPLLSTSAR